jgi:hypothetical protein
MTHTTSKLDARQIVFQPLYIPVASAIGFAFVLILFLWNYPLPDDPVGKKFVSVPEFWVWISLLGLMSAFLTVVFAPLWKQFIDLLKEQISGQPLNQRIGLVLMILAGTAIYVFLIAFVYGITPSIKFEFETGFPMGHSQRVSVLYLYALITLLPLMAAILLVYRGVLDNSNKISSVAGNEVQLLNIANDLLRYRNLLQNYLLIAGIIVSIVPIATAMLRSILMTTGFATEQNFPIIIVISYGLFFTMVLILFYAPTHLLLTEASRKLRDVLCPIDCLSTVEEKLRQRKSLDEWLQTNIGLTQNLKAGIVALSPLISSFVASVLGVR